MRMVAPISRCLPFTFASKSWCMHSGTRSVAYYCHLLRNRRVLVVFFSELIRRGAMLCSGLKLQLLIYGKQNFYGAPQLVAYRTPVSIATIECQKTKLSFVSLWHLLFLLISLREFLHYSFFLQNSSLHSYL